MDENLSRGYIQLGKNRAANDFRFSNGFNHLSPPVDKYNGVYFALVLAGAGFLLPYNSFTIAVDYFQSRYPGTTIVFDISLTYIIMAFFAVLGNNILVESLSLNFRITCGYIISFVTLLFVTIGVVWWDVFNQHTSYLATLTCVCIVALGCTVQQSSFYGYTSMLPSRYTQAVMAGESAAGLLISINRIVTKVLLDDQTTNTIIFFTLSIVIVAICFGLHQYVNKTDFVKFYITLCSESKKITLEPTEDIGLMDSNEQPEQASRSQFGVLKLHTSPTGGSTSEYSTGQYSSLSFANPVYEPQASGPSYKVEDVVMELSAGTHRKPGRWRGLQRGLSARWEVAKVIWPYMLTIAFAYFITLCLYPGIVSEITSCRLRSWMPILVMAIFNAADLTGKILASVSYDWTRTSMLIFAACRLMLVPLLLLCAMPRGRAYISGEGYPMFFSMLLGLTNGIIGSIPMIQAPSKVSEEHRELTGNIMTLSYNIGLTGGSVAAYLLDAMLGEKNKTNCPPLWPSRNQVLTTTRAATTVTTVTPLAATVATMLLNTTTQVYNTTATLATTTTTLATLLVNGTTTTAL